MGGRSLKTPGFKRGKKEDLGNYRLVSLISVTGKVIEQTNSEIISKHIKVKKLTGSSQHGFMKGKSRLTNPIAFCDKTMDEGTAVIIVCLDFGKAFSTVSGNIFIYKFVSTNYIKSQ